MFPPSTWVQTQRQPKVHVRTRRPHVCSSVHVPLALGLAAHDRARDVLVVGPAVAAGLAGAGVAGLGLTGAAVRVGVLAVHRLARLGLLTGVLLGVAHGP